MSLSKPVVAGFILIAMLSAFAGERREGRDTPERPALIARQDAGK